MWTFASWLVFEAKGELTKAKDVLASSRPEESWYTFLIFMDLVCSQISGSMLKEYKIAKNMLYENGIMHFMP